MPNNRGVHDASDDTGTSEPSTIEATFVCLDGTVIDALFDNAADTVTITLEDETLTLPRVPSGSDARYGDDTTVFWNQGDEALIEVNGKTLYSDVLRRSDLFYAVTPSTATAGAGGILRAERLGRPSETGQCSNAHRACAESATAVGL